MADRNPIIVPVRNPNAPKCPKCKCPDFGGRRAGGSIVFDCKRCGNKWQGGLSMSDAPSLDPATLMPISDPSKPRHRPARNADNITLIDQVIDGKPVVTELQNPDPTFRIGTEVQPKES